MTKFKETALGGVINNPTFVLVLGMCPTIAMSNTVENAFVLGVSTFFVLVLSNLFISLLRKVIPEKVRIPCYIIVIATLVTVVDLFLAKFIPGLYKDISFAIKLIVVNCIILARAESFASSNPPDYAALDGVSIGLGFILSMLLLGGIRQLLALTGLAIFSQTAGGFVVLGLLMGLFNYVYKYVTRRIERNKKLLPKGVS